MSIKPIVRHLLICNDWNTAEGSNGKRIDIYGLMSNLRVDSDPPFPVIHEELCVFLMLTDCYGSGKGKIKCVFEETDRVVFETTERVLTFQSSPLDVVGVPFRIRDCGFPRAGVYLFQFWYDGEMLAEQPVRLRAS